jgi:hypothetical protein
VARRPKSSGSRTHSLRRKASLTRAEAVERVTGIEPA